MAKLSIIVASYNSKETIQRCIESVLMQSFCDWELIIVDDGSADGTKACVEGFLENKKISYFYTEHNGVSAARNYGLSKAKGEFVLFCDADDEYPADAFRTIISKYEEAVDFIVFGAKIINCSDKYKLNSIIPGDELYFHNLEHALYYETGSRPYIWNCFYRRDFIEKNRLRFDERINLGEDHVFQFRAFLSADCVKFVSDVCYVHYNCRPNSCMMYYREHPVERIEKHFEIVGLIYDVYVTKGLSVSKDFYRWVLKFIFRPFIMLPKEPRKELHPKLKEMLKKIKYYRACNLKTYLKFLILRYVILQNSFEKMKKQGGKALHDGN